MAPRSTKKTSTKSSKKIEPDPRQVKLDSSLKMIRQPKINGDVLAKPRIERKTAVYDSEDDDFLLRRPLTPGSSNSSEAPAKRRRSDRSLFGGDSDSDGDTDPERKVDDQVGHLMRWVPKNHMTAKLEQHWPADSTSDDKLCSLRDHWGPVFDEEHRKWTETRLNEGP